MDECSLAVTEVEKGRIRESYGVSVGELRRDVEILKEWRRQKKYLPQKFNDDSFLERTLLRNKCSIQKSKRKLENYYTLKAVHNNFFKDMANVVIANQASCLFPLPKLTKTLERVLVWKLKHKDPEVFCFEQLSTMIFASAECIIHEDYSIGERMIYDLDGFSYQHFKKMSPSLLTKIIYMNEAGYSGRTVGIEFVNSPSWLSKILALLRPLLKQKIFNRISVHESLESLHENVDKEVLPREYGGSFSNTDQLIENWGRHIESKRGFLAENAKQMADLRLKSNDHGDIFLEGSFKKLNID